MNDTPKRHRRGAAPRSSFSVVEVLVVLAILCIMAMTVAISLSALT